MKFLLKAFVLSGVLLPGVSCNVTQEFVRQGAFDSDLSRFLAQSNLVKETSFYFEKGLTGGEPSSNIGAVYEKVTQNFGNRTYEVMLLKDLSVFTTNIPENKLIPEKLSAKFENVYKYNGESNLELFAVLSGNDSAASEVHSETVFTQANRLMENHGLMVKPSFCNNTPPDKFFFVEKSFFGSWSHSAFRELKYGMKIAGLQFGQGSVSGYQFSSEKKLITGTLAYQMFDVKKLCNRETFPDSQKSLLDARFRLDGRVIRLKSPNNL